MAQKCRRPFSLITFLRFRLSEWRFCPCSTLFCVLPPLRETIPSGRGCRRGRLCARGFAGEDAVHAHHRDVALEMVQAAQLGVAFRCAAALEALQPDRRVLYLNLCTIHSKHLSVVHQESAYGGLDSARAWLLMWHRAFWE